MGKQTIPIVMAIVVVIAFASIHFRASIRLLRFFIL